MTCNSTSNRKTVANIVQSHFDKGKIMHMFLRLEGLSWGE